MLSSLRRTVLQTRNFNGGNSPTHLYCFVLAQNPYLSITKFSSSPNSSSFVINYLISKCGLSEHQAITVSKKINFKTSTKPDSILSLLENYGFTEQYISKTITKCPSILLRNHHKTLKPKLDFFNFIGLSGIDLVKFLSSHTSVLASSLNSSIIPTFRTLENIVHSDKNVITIIKRHSWILTGKIYVKNLKVNIELLRDEGVPQSNVSKFLINQPSVLTMSTTKFEEIVQKIKAMGFDPSKTIFLGAIQGLAAMTKSTWETKLNAFRKWGLSEEEIQNAFQKHPRCMMHSENKIMSIMGYLVNQMGYNPSLIAEYPLILCFSLEKRIIPRCVVIQLLVSQGQIKEHYLGTILTISEKSFLEKYVSKYEAEVPELLKVYHNSLSITS